MRIAVISCVVLICSLVQAAPPARLRVAIQCEEEGRTKACPAFLLGFVDSHEVLLSSPRATAEVIVYVTASEVALVDRVHLRFVSTVTGVPAVIEIDTDLDTRASDDAQRAQLEPAFLRGIALHVAVRHPASVTVALSEPKELAVAEADTTPWGIAFAFGASGNRTERFKAYAGFAEVGLVRMTQGLRLEATATSSGNLNRQPALVLDDGTEVSLDTEQWSVGGGTEAAWLYDDRWSFGGKAQISRDDPKSQFRYASSARAGVEWDNYAADDPRGNRLAVMYYAGYQAERYNLRNVIGERFAHYPVHGLVVSGTLRKDTVAFGLSLSAGSQMFDPQRRHHVSASPFVDIQLGGHVDLSVSFSITKREMPAPDETLIDPLDFEQQSRLSFAEPLSMNGSLNVTIHWDHTNGARNDRFSDL
ncbi:MAG: hypothetical protein JWP01_1106 [Myxococcales bacterium]|nr:hypothetical protein [Myxococcales bacterium]